jgi:hypothetical protein
MGKCANPTCDTFTLAVYCKSCSATNRAVNSAVESAEAVAKSKAEDETISAVIASLKAEYAALKEDVFPESLVSKEYLDGLEHAILLVQNEYAPETLSEYFAADAELYKDNAFGLAEPTADASPLTASRSVWDAQTQEEADRSHENSTYDEYWTNIGRVDERYQVLRELKDMLNEAALDGRLKEIVVLQDVIARVKQNGRSRHNRDSGE